MRYVSCPHAPIEDSGMLEPGLGAAGLPILEVYIPIGGTLAAENGARTDERALVGTGVGTSCNTPLTV
jgi:hypothetical protein